MKKFFHHHAFKMLIYCMLVQGAAIGICYNCFGVFMVAVCQTEGFSTASFSLANTIRVLSSAVTMFFFPRWVYGRMAGKLRYIVLACAITMFGAFAMGAFYHGLIGWYISSILLGMGGALFNLNQAYIIGNWCKKNTNFFIGLSGASSGIAGLIFNPLASWMIQLMGWKYTLLILCAFGCIAMCYGGMHMYLTPEEIGCTPYMDKETKDRKGEKIRIPSVVIFPIAVASILPILVLAVYFSSNCLAVCLPHLPNYATELGYILTTAALFSSFSMAGNILGKVVLGMLCDRFDWRKVTIGVFLLMGCACIGICLSGHNLLITLIFCLLMGMSQSTSNVLAHIMMKQLFGTRKYVDMFSKTSAISSIATAPIYTLMGWSYDRLGSYHLSFVLMGSLLLISAVILIIVFRLKKQGEDIYDIEASS